MAGSFASLLMTSISKIAILAVVTLSFSMIPAFAETETILPPLQQFNQGIPISEIQCRDDRVLMQSPSGMPACVFSDSVPVLEQRWFDVPSNEQSDAFSIRSSDMPPSIPSSSSWSLPQVSMSNIPNINETAVVTITYTNTGLYNITDTEEFSSDGHFTTGWQIIGGYEIVDSGGLQYEEHHPPNVKRTYYLYEHFTPLDIGESKTYTIIVKAVKEELSGIHGLGYEGTNAGIQMSEVENVLPKQVFCA